MNNKIEIKNYNEFEQVIENFETILKEIKEIFDKQNINVELINQTETWTSKTQDELVKKYNELKVQYGDIEQSLTNYINFMKKSLSDYKELEKKLDNDTDKNDTNLDVN